MILKLKKRELIFIIKIFFRTNHFQFPTQSFLSPGVKFRRQHWLFLLICLLVFVIILSIYLPIAGRVDNIEVIEVIYMLVEKAGETVIYNCRRM